MKTAIILFLLIAGYVSADAQKMSKVDSLLVKQTSRYLKSQSTITDNIITLLEQMHRQIKQLQYEVDSLKAEARFYIKYNPNVQVFNLPDSLKYKFNQ